MAIGTYAELKAAVVNWLHRSDLAERVPEFIALAEARIQHDITDIAPLLSGGVIITIPGQRKYAADLIRLNWAVRKEPTTTPLQIVGARELADKYSHEQYRSIPQQIAYDGVNLVLHPTPSATFTISYTCQDRLAPLSADADTNLVLQRFPGLYLYGALQESAPFIRDDARAALWASKYAEALQNARSVDYVGDARLRVDLALRRGGFNFLTGD